MTDWLIAQQGVLSAALLFLLFAERFLTKRMGAVGTYALWLLVPLALIANNLPFDIVAVESTSITRFVVGMTPNIASNEMNILFSVWAIGASAITSFVLVHHFSTWHSISRQKAFHTDAYYSSKAATPMLFGFIAPKILLPYSFKSVFSQSQQSLVLEHETMHQKHFDHVWNTLALVLAAMFWFNPLMWLALKSFRINQELACDYHVLKNKSEVERITYAKALVQCAEACSKNITLYPTFGEKTTMMKRLNAIKQPASGNRLIAAAALSIATLFMANTVLANAPQAEMKKASAKINEAWPTKRIEPNYPEKAIEENIEGYVVLEFDITETGTTDNIQVVQSSPKGVFDKNALAAFKQWEYKPAIKNGKGVRQQGLLVQLDFKLAPEPLNANASSKM